MEHWDLRSLDVDVNGGNVDLNTRGFQFYEGMEPAQFVRVVGLGTGHCLQTPQATVLRMLSAQQ